MKFQLFDVFGTHLFNMGAMTITLFFLFLIIVVGYFVGHISIKGVSLGSAAIFIVALFVGHFKGVAFENIEAWQGSLDKVNSYFKMVQNLGLVLFVTSIGLIAGPSFFKNLVKNAKSYVLLGLTIILSGALVCAAITILVPGMKSAMSVGLLSGALTSTPAFAAAQEAVGEALSAEVAVGQAIAYPFGVIGVVLFVQIIPKLLKADIDKERALIVEADTGKGEKHSGKKYFNVEKYGIAPFALTIVCGLILGSINIPLGKGSFSLGTTGGPLIIGLIFGHFGHIGKFNMKADEKLLGIFQELGLILFLIGAGTEGGAGFVKTLSEYGAMLFVYGALMTLIPMILGFLVAKYVVKLSLFNNLGSLCGGMTSTPALGTLIHVTGTPNVASAYAATYPIALITIVLAAQLLTRL